MKIAKLLVLSALLLIGSIAKAEVPDGVWTIPEPEGLEFTDVVFDEGATKVYFYNPVAKMFFASGNDWNTRASIAAFGYEMWFQTSTEEDAPAGSYEFWDNCQHPDRVLGDKNMFTDDGGSTWVDHASQANYSWSVTKVGDNTYRFQNVALVADFPDFDGKYIGWKGDYADTRLYMLAEGEGAIDWKAVSYDSYQAFVESKGYEVYKTACDCFSLALALKASLEEAETLGANIATQLAVYNNTSSTPDELKAANDAIKAIIEARKSLKKALDDAKAAGFSETAAYDAVFDNGDATADELKKALEDLNAAVIEWGKGHASVEHPADMTSKIKNPTFDNADATTGWSGDAFGRGGTVSDGAEHYSKNYDTYQTIKDLTPGVYAVGVNGYYRSGNYGGTAEGHWLANDAASKYAKFYAKVGESYFETPIANVMSGAQTENPGAQEVKYTDPETQEEVTVYVPNTMAQADIYFHTLGQYANRLYVIVDEAGELTIGVKKSSQIDGDWSMFDDFSLTYYGSGSDAAELFLEETLKNYSEMTIDEGTIFTEAYLTAYNEALKQEINVSSLEEVAAALAGIEAANQAIVKNIELWKEWLEAVEKARNNYVFNGKYQGLAAMDDLADYVDDMNTEPILDEHNWTNEELEAEIQKIADMIQAVIDESLNAAHEDGDDMTDYIKNPGFDEDKDINSGKAEGWTIDSGTGGNITRGPLGQDNKNLMEQALGYMNYCFEAWHRYNWDVWQEIENLPKGMYELSVQGYVRCEVSGYNRGDDINPDYPSPIYLYMNSATAQFPSVYSEDLPEGKEFTTVESWTQETINDKPYPNSMGGAAQCFGWGMYEMKAYGLIAKQGDKFRIGVRMEGTQDWWCIWDNFKLTYRKPTVEIVQPILEAELQKLDLSQAMGSEVFGKVSEVREMAEAAIASGDGEQMFDALVEVYNVSDAIRSSVNKFKELETALEALGGKINEGQVASIKAEAQDLYTQIQDGIDNHTIATDEVETLKGEITKMINRLGLPADMDQASDENPVECTTVIINPAYVDGNDEGWTGAAAVNGEALDAEKFNTTYNYYQVIQGLPAGTYDVVLQGYYRAGSATVDYDSYVENPEANNNAFLYAAGENADTCSVPMMRLASQAISTDALSDGYAWASEANQLAVPNSMATGGEMFMTFNETTGKNYYDGNTVTVKVGEDGNLTIGLKKKELITDDWTLWTNWRLYYYGKNSSKTPNNDPSGIKELSSEKPVSIEFFNLNGVRINKPQKGIAIMKQKMNDGTVKVTKIMIK